MQLVLAVGAGLLAGAFGALLVVFAVRSRRPGDAGASVAPAKADELARQGLQALRVGVVVLDAADDVVFANPSVRRMRVLRGAQLAQGSLRTLARQARRAGETRDTELDLPRGKVLEPLAVRVRVAPIGLAGHVLLQVEDITEAHLVQKVRRDFVANVSHELKTPVGALALLAEALGDAVDDPEAVRRFSARMRHEATRLARLVQELIDLSRLQGAEPQPDPQPVVIDDVVAEVVDRARLTAEARQVSVVAGGERGLVVMGSESQLRTALANLVENAIVYSAEDSRVAIGTRRRDDLVEISVSDQGIGIAESDLDRIFERFYRADPARSRETGGTGLGLAIVKHIATNHCGSVDVWSVQGSGSTFTLRLPAPDPEVSSLTLLPPVEEASSLKGTS